MSEENNELMKEMPAWAVELGLSAEDFSALVRESFRRRVRPAVLAQEWIKEMAAKMVA